MIFKGGILGGARKFYLDSYLNSTTIPFDVHAICKPEGFFFWCLETPSALGRLPTPPKVKAGSAS